MQEKIQKCWRTKHGDSRTRLYHEWQSMRYRCNYTEHTAYHKYGGIGIKVCKAWDDSYTDFRDWALKNGYADNLTIDRIDGDSGYSSENCRWVTYQAQNTNLGRLKTNTSGYRGVSWNKERKMWRCNLSINNKCKWIGDFKTIEEAILARNAYIKEHNLPHQPAEFTSQPSKPVRSSSSAPAASGSAGQ